MSTSEIWKPIPGFNNKEISNHGNVRNPITGKLLKQTTHKQGYKRITFNNVAYLVHRLVAIGFVDNPENKPTVNHKDGNKANNRSDNLEWATQLENNKHARDAGLRPVTKKMIAALSLGRIGGVSHPKSKITEEGLRDIRKMYGCDIKQSVIAEIMGISRPSVNRIIKNKSYCHVHDAG